MNKTVVVTGGSRGIGKAISSLFAENDYNVVINYNKSENLAIQLAEHLKASGYNVEVFKADVSKSCEAKELMAFAHKTFGSVDVLINNAGVAQQKLLTDITDEDFANMITINLASQFYCCREAAKYMINKKYGNIINISSMWGISGASMESHYSAAKSGIIGLTKSLAKELGPSNIRVNCLAPGLINTDMNAHLDSDTISELVNATQLCRIGTPEDIAAAALFLASDQASFITGQTISIDGGFIL